MRVLVAEDDPVLRHRLHAALSSWGYDVTSVVDGQEALREVGRPDAPNLAILDWSMPKVDGLEVCRAVRKRAAGQYVYMILLTSNNRDDDVLEGFDAGADDYIIKPFDPIELLARVKGTLRRAKEMRNLSPLTGLPGNIRIQEEIERQVGEEREFAVLYCDLDNFKAYNDQKGFVRGDRLIQATARIIQDSVVEGSGAEGFVGHVGGDDFVAVVEPAGAEVVAKRVCERFDEARGEFYEADDLERGFVRIEDRKGVLQDIPLVAISVGIASTSKRHFAHYGEAVAVATEMKSYAKREQGSSYAVDRRTEV